jgi:hypothetical protein
MECSDCSAGSLWTYNHKTQEEEYFIWILTPQAWPAPTTTTTTTTNGGITRRRRRAAEKA